MPAEYQALSDPPAERYTQFMTPAGSIRTANSIIGDDDKSDSWFSKLARRRPSTSSARSLKQNDNEKAENGMAGQVNEDNGEEHERAIEVVTVPNSPSDNGTPTPASRGADTFSINTADTKRSRLPKIQFPGLAPLKSIVSRKELPADTPLPFIDEVKLVITTFLLPGSAKELNIDARLRRHVLKYLQPTLEDGSKGDPITTHPDVFKDVAEHVLALMERSLPHYMQWAKGNTNTPKRLFWTAVGIFDMGLGVMFAMIILYFARSRWYRIFSFFFFWFGSMQFYSAYFYFCSQVHGRTSRQLYPWELTDSLDESTDGLDLENPKTTSATPAAKLPTSPATSNDASPFPTTNGAGTGAAKTDKGLSGLQESLPFLFEPPIEPYDEQLEAKNKPEAGKPARTPRFRGKFFASMRDRNGKRLKAFGPERVVEDPYIKVSL